MSGDDHDQAVPELPATTWAVLGLLSFGTELSGYDMKKWADWSLQFFYWAPSYSQIYGELRRLETLGYVSSRVVDKDGVRSKRMYTISRAGSRAIAHWAEHSAVESVVLKHTVLLRVWLGQLSDPRRLREMVADHSDHSEKMRRRAAADAEGASAEPGWAYPELALRWAERYYASERDHARWMLAELDRLAARTPDSDGADARVQQPLEPAQLRMHERASLTENSGTA